MAKRRFVPFLYPGLLVILLTFGILDETHSRFIPPYEQNRAEYLNDGRFIQKVEVSLPPQAKIFQLPYVPFPESGPIHRMWDYDHFRGYLHSKTLKWSFGAIRGREGDRWQKEVVSKSVPELIKTLRQSGFQGIYLDRFGYTDLGLSFEKQLREFVGNSPITSENQRLVFYPL